MISQSNKLHNVPSIYFRLYSTEIYTLLPVVLKIAKRGVFEFNLF